MQFGHKNEHPDLWHLVLVNISIPERLQTPHLRGKACSLSEKTATGKKVLTVKLLMTGYKIKTNEWPIYDSKLMANLFIAATAFMVIKSE